MLRTILETDCFSAWEAALASTLGHHRSQLIGKSTTFSAHARLGSIGSLGLLHLQGSGALELDRHQCQRHLLWIPLAGCSEERVNGIPWQAAPGQMLLFQPGDHLLGHTAEQMEGISVLLPAPPEAPQAQRQPLQSQPLINATLGPQATTLLAAIQHGDPGRAIAAQGFLDAVEQIFTQQTATPLPPLKPRQRWEVVMEADRWLKSHLLESFSVHDLAAALGIPTRTLQHAFQYELGRSPLAHCKRLRLSALRQLLQDPKTIPTPIAALMQQCGLLACGATAQSYLEAFGELPRQTRQRTINA